MHMTVILALAAVLLGVTVDARAQPPAYAAEYAGPGQSAAVNSTGIVIGNDSTVYPGQPWVNDGNVNSQRFANRLLTPGFSWIVPVCSRYTPSQFQLSICGMLCSPIRPLP